MLFDAKPFILCTLHILCIFVQHNFHFVFGFFFMFVYVRTFFASPKNHKNIHRVVKLFFFLVLKTPTMTLCRAIHALFYIAYILRVCFFSFHFLCLLFCFSVSHWLSSFSTDKPPSIQRSLHGIHRARVHVYLTNFQADAAQLQMHCQ